ncbi:MAG: phosphatidate cytidylyltransferase [Oscillospiraceae bacterium]|nr:phosphatidate cytidylyltransferase [Oscillospiraceae bacterium]
MKTRIISAAVALVILAAVLLLFETPVLDVAIALVSVIAVYEVINAVGLAKNRGFLAVCAVFAAFFSSTYYQTFSSIASFVDYVFAGIILLFVLADKDNIKFNDAAAEFFAVIIIPKIFSMILLFRNYGSTIAYFLVMLSLAVAWFNDTCAYFSGYFFGKRKLCPEISPKKTVEGAIGGVFGDVILCCAFALIFGMVTGYSVNWVNLVIFLPVGAVAAILGDLCFSAIKRQLNIKDYGNIMPGHGGVLDRFDSWLFVVPLLYMWNIYFPFI